MKFLNAWTVEDFTARLHELKLIEPQDCAQSFEVAGEGNMNFTYRVCLHSNKTLIAKQSPPYCAKFPQIPAPKERILAEAEYYWAVSQKPFLRGASPQILGLDRSDSVLYLEDLGPASDFENLYAQSKLNDTDGKFLIRYLSELHAVPGQSLDFSNAPMRELNHDYIFTLPFESESSFDLDSVTPGLNEAARVVRRDPQIKKIARDLGQIYLHDKNELVHGDYYPRSWIKTSRGTYVIDPEFGHVGKKEFDLGVFLAHLALCGQYQVGMKLIRAHYPRLKAVDQTLFARFCSIEILRRLLFVAQVPIKNQLEFKKNLIDASAASLLEGTIVGFDQLQAI